MSKNNEVDDIERWLLTGSTFEEIDRIANGDE